MTHVFISGSIKIKRLDDKVLDRLRNIVDSKFGVIIGDADGVDSSIQEFLKTQHVPSVVVYCSGDKPRNNLGNWPIKNVTTTFKPGTREFFMAKDKTMAEDCDCGFMVWDTRSTGTLSNVVELVSRGKAALVYVTKTKEFLKVKDASDLQSLLALMSDTALSKANEKVGILRKLDSLRYQQHDLLDSQRGTG